METLIVKGPQRLIGEVCVNGAKNGVLPLMVCALLTENDLTLTNVPILTDVYTMIELLENYGAKIYFDKQERKITINCKKIDKFYAPSNIVTKMRASIWTLAPILAKFGQAKIALPGGCPIGNKQSGSRQIDLHLSLLEQMGAEIVSEDSCILAKLAGKLKATTFYFKKISVGATINGILAAVCADGESVLNNCAIEPEITDMCHCLVKMGAIIEGIGSRMLKITGIDNFKGAAHKVIPDRIEAGTYLMMAAITKGQIKVNGINENMLQALCSKLQEAGSEVICSADSIFLKGGDKILPVNISTEPFPGFVTDLQAQFMSLMCLAEGTSHISENIYDNRFMHVAELNKMGANIVIQDKTATVVGVPQLHGGSVYASDLRASVCLVLAGLAADGVTTINNAHHLSRGYEELIDKVARCQVTLESLKAQSTRKIVA
jgi:UDP-N-acetylglucosamine 1-carboxyvinyltransferase